MKDSELLQRYADEGCEAAFTELVKRYVDLVYSAAMRQVSGNAELAQDVTQTVFIDLARKAKSLSSHTLLTGWLYTGTRYAAARHLRAEQRRHTREQEASTMQQLVSHSEPEPQWDDLRPVLDEAIHELGERERNAVLLRYFGGRQLADVGAHLGLSEDAARMRVARALEKLRGLLAKRGITTSATALGALLVTQTVIAAPAGLASVVARGAIAGAPAATVTILSLLKIMTMTKLKLSVVGAVVLAGMATPLLLEHQTQVKLRNEVQSLRGEREQKSQRLALLAAQNFQLSNLLAQANGSDQNRSATSNELLKLRGEVARLRAEARESSQNRASGTAADTDSSMESSMKTWAARAAQLKQRLEEMPDKKIPELQFISDKDWFDAVKNAKQLETDADYRQALNDLRNNAKHEFDRMLQKALSDYAQANGDMVPTNLSQLKPYFERPVDDDVLRRYTLLQTGKVSEVGDYLVAETAPPVDDDYDSVHKISINGVSSSSVNKVEDAVKDAGVKFAEANNGNLPTDPSQLAPYLKEPIDSSKVQRILAKIPPGVTTLDQLKTYLR